MHHGYLRTQDTACKRMFLKKKDMELLPCFSVTVKPLWSFHIKLTRISFLQNNLKVIFILIIILWKILLSCFWRWRGKDGKSLVFWLVFISVYFYACFELYITIIFFEGLWTVRYSDKCFYYWKYISKYQGPEKCPFL